ncbi:MAG: hypothetical protein IKU24_04210 [Clostridia bacterium]|nr:hypothetical protein [Clostridia bacterium]
MKWKNLSLFWRIYWIAFASFVALILLGAILLFSYLSAFEKSQPVHSAREIFEEYFLSEDYKAALEKANFKVGEQEEISHAAKAFEKLLEGRELSFYSVGVEKGVAKYNVVAEKKENHSDLMKIATIFLEKGDEKISFGLVPYTFSHMEIYLEPSFSATVKIPSEFTLFVNGKEVKTEDADKISDHPWNEYLPVKTKKVYLAEFRLSDLYCEPEIVVYDTDGKEAELVKNEETGVLEADLLYEKITSGLAVRLLAGMKEYAKFIQADGSAAAVGQYFDRSSLFYQNTIRNPAIWVEDHDGFSFEKEVVEDFYFFDENTLCCHIAFDHVLKTYGKEDYIDPVDMTIFARKIGGEWYIFDRIAR